MIFIRKDNAQKTKTKTFLTIKWLNCPNIFYHIKYFHLVIVELCGEVWDDWLDDGAHGEWARVEGGPDGGPVALEVAPGQEAAGGVGGDRGEDGVDILTPHLAGVQAHRQVPAQGERGQ